MFKINQVVYDSEAKEFVKLTNGTDAGGVFTPTEAIALRLISMNKGKPQIAFTYRQVKPEFLKETTYQGYFDTFMVNNNPGFEWIGRV